MSYSYHYKPWWVVVISYRGTAVEAKLVRGATTADRAGRRMAKLRGWTLSSAAIDAMMAGTDTPISHSGAEMIRAVQLPDGIGAPKARALVAALYDGPLS